MAGNSAVLAQTTASLVNTAVNKKIADKNLEYQKEKDEYEKALQQKIFEREDSAYQRTVNDMRSAGLSPFMMNGTNGAGEAIAKDALHYDFNPQLDSIVSSAFNAMDMAETIRSKRIENDMNEQTAAYRKAETEANAIITRYNALSAREKKMYDSYFGLSDSMTNYERYAHILGRTFNVPLNDFYGSPKNTREGVEDFSKSLSDFSDYSSPHKLGSDDIKRLGSNLSGFLADMLGLASGSDSDLEELEADSKSFKKKAYSDNGLDVIRGQFPDKIPDLNYLERAKRHAAKRARKSR